MVAGLKEHFNESVSVGSHLCQMSNINFGQGDLFSVQVKVGQTRFHPGAPRNSRTSTSLRLAEPLWRARDQPRTITQLSDARNRIKPGAILIELSKDAPVSV